MIVKIKVINNKNYRTARWIYEDRIIELTKEIKQYYPNYDKWLDKVFEEVKLGKRKILLLKDTCDIIGLAIIKIEDNYIIKLCSFIIAKEYRRQGYGDKLMKEIITQYSKNPIFTMNEKVFYDFRSLLIKYNFKYSKIEKGVYNKEDTEIYFNL